MRQIKYRGKCINGKGWIYGVPVNYGDGVFIADPKMPINELYGGIYKIKAVEVFPDSVGQFTGLTDKKNTEIYEDDIVFCNSWNPNKYRIMFADGGFALFDLDGTGMGADITLMYDSKGIHFEVVGHIHGSPK
jgi:hypothetical protein